MTTTSKDGNFIATSVRIHVSAHKTLKEIFKLYDQAGIRKINQSEHYANMIRLYSETLRKKKIKPGHDVAEKLFRK